MAPKVIKDCGADFCKKNHYIKFVESCLDGPVHGFMDTKDFIKLVDCASEEAIFHCGVVCDRDDLCFGHRRLKILTNLKDEIFYKLLKLNEVRQNVWGYRYPQKIEVRFSEAKYAWNGWTFQPRRFLFLETKIISYRLAIFR